MAVHNSCIPTTSLPIESTEATVTVPGCGGPKKERNRTTEFRSSEIRLKSEVSHSSKCPIAAMLWLRKGKWWLVLVGVGGCCCFFVVMVMAVCVVVVIVVVLLCCVVLLLFLLLCVLCCCCCSCCCSSHVFNSVFVHSCEWMQQSLRLIELITCVMSSKPLSIIMHSASHVQLMQSGKSVVVVVVVVLKTPTYAMSVCISTSPQSCKPRKLIKRRANLDTWACTEPMEIVVVVVVEWLVILF